MSGACYTRLVIWTLPHPLLNPATLSVPSVLDSSPVKRGPRCLRRGESARTFPAGHQPKSEFPFSSSLSSLFGPQARGGTRKPKMSMTCAPTRGLRAPNGFLLRSEERLEARKGDWSCQPRGGIRIPGTRAAGRLRAAPSSFGRLGDGRSTRRGSAGMGLPISGAGAYATPRHVTLGPFKAVARAGSRRSWNFCAPVLSSLSQPSPASPWWTPSRAPGS